MRTSYVRTLLVCFSVPGIVVATVQSPRMGLRDCCSAQESVAGKVDGDLARAIRAIRRDREGVGEGFAVLGKMDLAGACPDELLALVHDEGEPAQESLWRLGMLIHQRKLLIPGMQLAAEYDKAGKSGRRARQALCAFAAYQTRRGPPDSFFGEKIVLAMPEPLDDETLALLARALADDDPAVRVAAADSVRLAGVRDDRFVELLLKAIEDENAVVSDAASLAAAELGCQRAGPLILRRLEKDIEAPRGDRRGDLNACGLPLSPGDDMRLWRDYYSPRYLGGGWVLALGMLRYEPGLPVLRKMAAPREPTQEEMEYLTGGENKVGWAEDLAKAIVEIEDRPHRPAALLDLAANASLAGNVRAAALGMIHDCDSACQTRYVATGETVRSDSWPQYYEPEILQRIVKLIDDKSPITNRSNDPSRLGRWAIEVAARKFDPRATYYQERLSRRGRPNQLDVGPMDQCPLSYDPNEVYPENLHPVRRQFQEKLESLLPTADGVFALEALAVACPWWGTIEKYVAIATDPKRLPLMRFAAANLLTWQPSFLELEGGGSDYGMNAPPETAGKLLSLLEIRGELKNSRYQDAVTNVFVDLLGSPHPNLTDKQKAARQELLPRLRAMHGGPHAEAALRVLFAVYGFSRDAQAWDANVEPPADRPRPPDETGAGVPVGPPVEETARRCFDMRHGIGFFTLAQKGKTLLVGDGSVLGHASGSRVFLVDPRDLSDRATTSISADLPWSSHGAILGRDEQHVLVFNRYLNLGTLKTVSVLDIEKAVAEGNVRPEPLAISPNGKSALVHVHSYLDSKLDSLALFDLASGRLERLIDVGLQQPISNACFLDEKEIAVQGRNECVLGVNLENGRQRVLCEDGPNTICGPGRNWHMAVLAGGYLVVSGGYDEFVVIETPRGKEAFRKFVQCGNALPVLGGRFLLYQPRLGFDAAPVFFCARVSDGKVVAKLSRKRTYDTLIPGDEDDVVYAADHDAVSRLHFHWRELLGDGE